MHAQALIPILAERFDYPIDTAFRIDRVLAGAGMRAKGKGRDFPDVTRREALTFLVACMVTDKVTKASEEVVVWLDAAGQPNPYPDKNVVEEEWEERIEDTQAYKYYSELKPLLAPYLQDNGDVALIDYLEVLCTLIENGTVEADSVSFVVDFSDQNATVSYEHGTFSELDVIVAFSAGNALASEQPDPRPKSSGIKRKCSVSGATLTEIIHRT